MSVNAPPAMPTDFYDEAGHIKSCGMSSHPAVGDMVVLDGRMLTVQKRSWDFDAQGVAVLVRIYVGKA